MSRLMQPARKELTFDVLAEIAAGTTARIELCRVREPKDKADQLVAVKRLHKHIAQDPQFADMFFDEVWMTAALHHQNVVDVVGWGNDRDGTYLAVELVQGVSLARLMKTVFETGEMFSERMVVFLGCSICAGLSAAHGLTGQDGEHLRLVHRDLTPGNVLIGFNGQIKITDFGLAKAKQRVTKTLTGLLKGHPQYMAPEMVRGFEIDSRADLFSLGVVLFELFGGQHPWSGGTELEIMRVTATDPPKDLLSVRPKLDKELASIVHGLLEKDPATRFQNADEVRGRLLTWLDAHGYAEGNEEALGRFVRRNAMRQMRWFERAVAGELAPVALPAESLRLKARALARDKSKATPSPRVRRNRKGSDEGPDSYADSGPSSENLDTDVTDVSSRAGILSLADTRPERDPRPRRAPPAPSGEAPAEGIDWGEEIPTVVQKKDPTTGSPFPIVDDDSDNRTTSVKSKAAMQAELRSAAAARAGVPSMVDMESDEVPTVPTRGDRKDALVQAIAAIPQRKADAAVRAKDVGPPRVATKSLPPPPPPVKIGPGGQRTSQRPIPALPPPPPATGADHRNEGQKAPAQPSYRPAPERSGPRAIDNVGALPLSGPSLNDSPLLAEADRLAVEAVRFREEADLAARVLAHKTRLAKLANDAASIAAEAVRAAGQGAMSRATSLMEDARRIETTVTRDNAIAPEDLPPVPRDAPTGFTSPPTQHQPRSATTSQAPPPKTTSPTFAGAAADLAFAPAPSGPLPLPLPRDPMERSGPQAMQAPVAVNGSSVQPSAPAFGAAPSPPTYSNPPPGPEYQSNSRMRPTVVPAAASPWEAFYRREVMGFPAPVAFVLAAVLLSSLIAAAAMLLR